MHRAILGLATLLSLPATTSHAHKPSDSYLRIDAGAADFSAEWDIALRDLELVVGLDSDRDGSITWGEVKNKRQAIVAHALSRLTVTAGGEQVGIVANDLQVTRHSDGAYAVLYLKSDASPASGPLALEYRLLFHVDPTHRGLVMLQNDGVTRTHILSPEEPRLRLDQEGSGLWQSFVQYVGEGVRHIWIGYDHILFLVCLLLPAVVIRRDGRWQGADSFRSACGGVLGIVTMFTLAHSITLWLSVMEYVALPSRFIEATIALSIIATAVCNLSPSLPSTGWRFAFAFGLVHGFGFANVLLDLGLADVSLACALFGFNVGVELGQIAIVLAFLPIAYVLSGTRFYRWVVLDAGSVAIALIAAVWFYERAFNAEILSASLTCF